MSRVYIGEMLAEQEGSKYNIFLLSRVSDWGIASRMIMGSHATRLYTNPHKFHP